METVSAARDCGEDEDDEELLVAASAWASSQNDDAEDEEGNNNLDSTDHSTAYKTSSQPLHNSSLQPQTYSLHLTRVPYEATQSEIRCSFIEKGCHVTSVRLVYDRDYKTGERNFRGVAFVDLADDKSFKRGLELNKTAFLGKGRKVNVRPTRTKNELSEIVRRTEEKVANLIARSKESAQTKKIESDGSSIRERDNKSSGSNKKRNKGRKSSDASTKAKSNNTEGSTEKPNKTKAKSSKRKRGTKSDKDDGSVKLTKKQRAKKAAVIRMMKIKGGKK